MRLFEAFPESVHPVAESIAILRMGGGKPKEKFARVIGYASGMWINRISSIEMDMQRHHKASRVRSRRFTIAPERDGSHSHDSGSARLYSRGTQLAG